MIIAELFYHTENHFWQTLTFAEASAEIFQLNPHNQPPKLAHLVKLIEYKVVVSFKQL